MNTINVEELMQDNFVLYNGKYERVCGTLGKGVYLFIDGAASSVHGHDCHPIPLTEEVLRKCGAKKLDNTEKLSDHYHFEINGGSALYVCYSKNGEVYHNTHKALFLINGAPYGAFPCKHLHQLQNLIFALTGNQLTFKL